MKMPVVALVMQMHTVGSIDPIEIPRVANDSGAD